MKQPVITSEKYVAAGAGMCPFCRSGDISGGPVEIEGTTAWQDVTCNDCQHNWQDIYEMTHYSTEFSEQPDTGDPA